TTRRLTSAQERTTCIGSRLVDETWRSELAEFIAIPSVSADSAHRDDVKEAGEWVCDFIRSKCGGTAELTPYGEKELALGEIRASEDADNAPTVLVYGRFDVPMCSLSPRGLIAFDVKVTTGERDLHSGMYGGAALNAIHVLMRSLSAVAAGPNGLLPEVLRQGIVPPTPEELENWKALPPGAEELELQGARPLDPDAAEQFNIRTMAEPSADVNGILGGKPGLRNTTLSVQAAGEITVRLAPGQDVDTIGNAVEKLMRDAAPDGAELDIRWKGVPAGLMKPDAPAIQLGADAFEQVLGVRPLLVRSGGTLPIVPALADAGIPTVLTGFGLPESNVHSPNEKFLVRYFEQGVDTAAALYTAYKDLPTT